MGLWACFKPYYLNTIEATIMKLTIFDGSITPFVAIGKHQCNLLDFAYKYPSWHYHGTDKSTMRALNGLIARNCIVINEHNQFRINMGA